MSFYPPLVLHHPRHPQAPRHDAGPACLLSLATANPPMYVTQQEAYDFLSSHAEWPPPQRELYRRVLLDGPIRGRHLAIDSYEQALETDLDSQLERFLRFGTASGAAAARDALAAADVQPEEVAALVVNTCTGYLCPGLSSYLAEAMGLPSTVAAMDLAGMGCGAAIPNLHTSAALAAGLGQKVVLSVAVEICSATFCLSDDPGQVVSNCIFGDGAAAAVVAGQPEQLRLASDQASDEHRVRVRMCDFESALNCRNREHLRYRSSSGRLHNVLGRRVPVLAARTIGPLVERLLARQNLRREDVDFWAVHPGGTRVLEQVGAELRLSGEDLRYSYEILREYGNMSSPSVLFVLQRILQQTNTRPGQRVMLLSFGAGFSAFGMLLEIV